MNAILSSKFKVSSQIIGTIRRRGFHFIVLMHFCVAKLKLTESYTADLRLRYHFVSVATAEKVRSVVVAVTQEVVVGNQPIQRPAQDVDVDRPVRYPKPAHNSPSPGCNWYVIDLNFKDLFVLNPLFSYEKRITIFKNRAN